MLKEITSYDTFSAGSCPIANSTRGYCSINDCSLAVPGVVFLYISRIVETPASDEFIRQVAKGRTRHHKNDQSYRNRRTCYLYARSSFQKCTILTISNGEQSGHKAPPPLRTTGQRTIIDSRLVSCFFRPYGCTVTTRISDAPGREAVMLFVTLHPRCSSRWCSYYDEDWRQGQEKDRIAGGFFLWQRSRDSSRGHCTHREESLTHVFQTVYVSVSSVSLWCNLSWSVESNCAVRINSYLALFRGFLASCEAVLHPGGTEFTGKGATSCIGPI